MDAALHGALQPADLHTIQNVYDRITSEPWFSEGATYREEFARYVLRMYWRGLWLPDKLEALCRTAAWNKFRRSRSTFEGYRFLLVEDDYLTAYEAADALKELGAEIVGPVSRLAEALDLIDHGAQLDGALLDVSLNGEVVYPAAAMLKMRQVPFVFVTGYESPVLPPSYRSATVFSKPAKWAEIATHLSCERDARRQRSSTAKPKSPGSRCEPPYFDHVGAPRC
jgi:CheY-like chemotaxis protein